MQLDPQDLDSTAVYKLLISSVVPRPIAWVSSLDAAGVPNLAPFSYFMAITDSPPTIAFSCSPRAGGKKDTLRNVEAAGEFVVNIVDDDRAEAMNLSSGEYAPEVDEFALAKLTAAPAIKVKAPRVVEAPISMECKLVRVLPVGKANLIIGEVVQWHVRDNGIGIDPRYHAKVLEPFQRLKEVDVEGSGVGLAIVKKIVDAAGGQIRIESALGEGSTFFFTWPQGA